MWSTFCTGTSDRSRYPGYYFLGFAENDKQEVKYYLLSPLKAFFRSLVKVQPFFVKKDIGKYDSLKALIEGEFKGAKMMKLIVFYEKIRTNGRGTIRIDKILCDHLYEISQDYLILQTKNASKKSDLFSLTSSGVGLVLTALGAVFLGNDVKVRATLQSTFNFKWDMSDTHSSNELR